MQGICGGMGQDGADHEHVCQCGNKGAEANQEVDP